MDWDELIVALERRAQKCRLVGFSQDFGDLPISVQRALFGIAGELDAAVEALRTAQRLPIEEGRILQRLPRAQEGFKLASKVAKPYNPADYPEAEDSEEKETTN